jgi:hypothetical protein
MTKKITRPKDWDRPGKRGQSASTADLRAPEPEMDGIELAQMQAAYPSLTGEVL